MLAFRTVTYCTENEETPIGELASIHSSKSDRRFSLISDPSRFGVRSFHSLLSKGALESDFKQLGVLPVADAVTARATLAKQFMAYAVFNPLGLYTDGCGAPFFIWRPLWTANGSNPTSYMVNVPLRKLKQSALFVMRTKRYCFNWPSHLAWLLSN